VRSTILLTKLFSPSKNWILRGIKDGVYTRALHGSHLGTELVANDVESIWIDTVRNFEAESSQFKAVLRLRLEFVQVTPKRFRSDTLKRR
jgi:hypothetical protein